MARPFHVIAPLVGLLLIAGCSSGGAHTAAPRGPASAAAGQATVAGAAPSGPVPSAGPSSVPAAGCPPLPADSVLRADVSALPAHPRSAQWVAAVGADRHAHPDFGSGTIDGAPFGIPVTTVPAGTARSAVTFEYAAESDRGPYPIPANPLIEGGPDADGDRHVLLHDPAGCALYELYAARRTRTGWSAGSGAVYDLRSNRLRPDGWTSADAAGLPIMPLLVRYEEVAAGRIDHALRITVPRSAPAHLWPARHHAGTDPQAPPMGLRLRLAARVDTARFPTQARVVAEAMKRYGVIVADNGSAWYLCGTQDERWDNGQLAALKTLTGADFEAVDVSGLMVAPDSGARRS